MEKSQEKLKKQYVFQMSSLNSQERIDYCHLIKKLGTSILHLFENLFLLVFYFKMYYYYNLLEYDAVRFLSYVMGRC